MAAEKRRKKDAQSRPAASCARLQRRPEGRFGAKGWAAAHPRPAAGRRQPPAAASARPATLSRRSCRRGAPRPPSCRQTAAFATAGDAAPSNGRAPQPAAPRSWRPRHSASPRLKLSGPPQTTRTELWQQRKDEKKMRKVGRRLVARGKSGSGKGGLGRLSAGGRRIASASAAAWAQRRRGRSSWWVDRPGRRSRAAASPVTPCWARSSPAGGSAA